MFSRIQYKNTKYEKHNIFQRYLNKLYPSSNMAEFTMHWKVPLAISKLFQLLQNLADICSQSSSTQVTNDPNHIKSFYAVRLQNGTQYYENLKKKYIVRGTGSYRDNTVKRSLFFKQSDRLSTAASKVSSASITYPCQCMQLAISTKILEIVNIQNDTVHKRNKIIYRK